MRIKTTVNRKTTIPTLKFVIKLQTYGRQINGEVPKLAFMDNEAPKEIINNDNKYNKYLLTFFHSITISAFLILIFFKSFKCI